MWPIISSNSFLPKVVSNRTSAHQALFCAWPIEIMERNWPGCKVESDAKQHLNKKSVLRFFSMLLRISQGVPLQELRRQPSQVCNEWMRFVGRACGQGIWNWNVKRLVRNVRNLGGLTMVYWGLGNFPPAFWGIWIFCHSWERWTRKRLPVCKRLMMVDGNDLQTHRIW